MKDIVAIYARISQEKDDVDVSIAQQIEQGKGFAHSMGMDFLVYKDEGYSGTLTSKERPAMYQLLQDIISKNSRIKILWGREMFRLYRGNTPKMEIQLVCKKHEVDIYYADRKLDSDDPLEKLMDNMLGVMGEFYVDLNKQNVKQAIKKNFSDGKAHGIAPYGYTTNKKKELIIDPEQARWVKQLYLWHIEGMGVTSLAKRLNDLNVPTQYNPKHTRFSKKWDRTTIYGILRNKLYHGKRTHLDKLIEAEDLAIIDEQTYNSSLLAFEKNKSRTGKRTFHKYLLNDILVCGHCKDRYLGRSDNRNLTVYRCNAKRKRLGCKNRDIRMEVIEKFIWDYLSDGETLLNNLKETSRNGGVNEKRNILQKELEILENINSKLNGQKSNIIRLTIEGLLSDEELKTDKNRIEREYVENKTKINLLQEQLQSIHDENHLMEELEKEFELIADSPVFEDDDEPLIQNLQLNEHRKRVINSRYGFNEKQSFIKKYIEQIAINYTNELFEILIKYKAPITDQKVYMDRKYYVAIDAETKKVFDLGNTKQHNVLKELKNLVNTVNLIT